jgi:hypothetical protein
MSPVIPRPALATDMDNFDRSSAFASRSVCFEKLSNENSELPLDGLSRKSDLSSDRGPPLMNRQFLTGKEIFLQYLPLT